ncbi:ATP-binding protein [Microbacterium sp. zg.B48]|uniref:ATP-binding protein n=1 Tax=Microbacterium sp. zg.B48 TaxID=2969408 RepID=UPI00214B9387|nr:ATP-binding protein [Microbacterium sp. zg.B48]MCR2764122.1 ATP-binding protein [Microbacterium sp. zg.B48]
MGNAASMTMTGPQNPVLAGQLPSAIVAPATDISTQAFFWSSFSISPRRVQNGGWAREPTPSDFAISNEIADVNMYLAAGGIRELYWCRTAEWALMTRGGCRLTTLSRAGLPSVEDVVAGDLWYFPAGLSRIIPGTVPGDLEADKLAAGVQWGGTEAVVFRLSQTAPVHQSIRGAIQIADSTNFAASKTIAAALTMIEPDGMRELHYRLHCNGSETSMSRRRVIPDLNVCVRATATASPSAHGRIEREGVHVSRLMESDAPSDAETYEQGTHLGGATDDSWPFAATVESQGDLSAADLLRCLAHDLRQPISTAAIALSQLAAFPADSSIDSRIELADIATHGVCTIGRLVDQLLDLTRVVDGSIQVVRERVDLVEITLAALEELALGPSDVRIDFPRDGAYSCGDAVLLERAVVNVLSNAHRHSPAGQPVCVNWTEHDGRSTLSIVDRGPGVTEADRESMFAQFWRAESTKASGLGLGLYLSRRFVELMGGAVCALDTDGGGLTIQISLPSAPVESIRAVEPVLLIDDDP